MKKVTKLVTIIAAGLCALALVPTVTMVNDSIAKADTGDIHAITCDFDDGILANVAVVGRAGKVIPFTLTYDADRYDIYNVLVNGNGYAVSYGNNKYSFVMPDEDVRLTTLCVDKLNDTPSAFAIINGAEKYGAVINYTKDFTEPGELVKFRIGLAPSCNYLFFGDITANILEPLSGGEEGQYTIGDEIVLSYDADQDIYSFIMPAAPVYILPSLTNKSYLMRYTTEEYDFIDKVEMSPNGANYFELNLPRVYGNHPESGIMIQEGVVVRITVKDSSKAHVLGAKVGTASVYVEPNTDFVEFQMPGQDFDLKILTEILWRKVSFANDELTNHYNWKLRVAQSSSGEYVERAEMRAVSGEYIRVYPTLKEASLLKKPNTFQVRVDGSLSGYGSSGTDDYGFYLQMSVSSGDIEFDIISEYDAHKVDTTFATAHITAKLVEKVNGKWVEKVPAITYYNEYMYIQFTVAGDDYSIGNPLLRYNTSSTNALKVEDEANNVYKSSYSASNYDYKLEFVEMSAIYKGYDFVGQYKGANVYVSTSSPTTYSGTAKTQTLSSSYNMTIDELGNAVKGTSTNKVITPDGDKTVKNGPGSLLIDGKRCHYSKNWFVSHYNFASDAVLSNDFLIGYRPSDTSVTNWRYHATFCKNMAAVAISAYEYTANKDGKLLGNMLLVRDKDVYFDVDFEFTTGTLVSSASSVFTIKQGGKTLGSISALVFTPAN